MAYSTKTGMHSVFDDTNTSYANNNSNQFNVSKNNINILILLSILINILL